LVIIGSVLGTWRSTPAPAEAVGAGDDDLSELRRRP
jgi:hypothetical protein